MKQTKYLCTSILVTLIAIVFLESQIIQLDKHSIYAQVDKNKLFLSRNGETIVIPTNDWVVIWNADYPAQYVSGSLLGVSEKGILIQEENNESYKSIPEDEIDILYHGKYKMTEKYIKKGMIFGGLIALCIGIPMTIYDNLTAGFFGTVCSSIFTIPVGASIGSIMGKSAEMKAVAYAIGPYDWQIVYE
jgi:hypothetical protein